LSPLNGKLEVEAYTREYWVEKAPTLLSLPLIWFMDGFGTYRNTHRTATGVYLTLAGMDQRQRSRRVNNFILTLGPHASDIGDVMNGIKDLKTLDKGTEMIINGERQWVCPFIHIYTGDMQQQNANAGILAPSATQSCRYCLVPAAQRKDLDYDIVANGRYHHHMKAFREHYRGILTKTDYEKLCSKHSMKVNDSPLALITPAIDRTRGTPMDPPHLNDNGIGKRSQTILITAVLTAKGQKEYVKQLQCFPFPNGWNRLQSPLHHLKSWSLQECARGTTVTPMLLRSWLRASHIKEEFLKAVRDVYKEDIAASSTATAEEEQTNMEQVAVDQITRSYALIAQCSAVCMECFIPTGKQHTFHATVISSRRAFQMLCQAAAEALENKPRQGASRASSLQPPQDTSRAGTPRPTPLPHNEPSRAPTASPARSTASEAIPDADKQGQLAPRKPKGAADFRRWMGLPNTHQGVHWRQVADWFATPRNINVLSGKDKHR
jgi:hypothetical protein